MSNNKSTIGRWIAAGLAFLVLLAILYNIAKDNLSKGDVRELMLGIVTSPTFRERKVEAP